MKKMNLQKVLSTVNVLTGEDNSYLIYVGVLVLVVIVAVVLILTGKKKK